MDVRAEVTSVDGQGAVFGGRVRFRLPGGTRLRLTDTTFEQPATVESWPRLIQTPQAVSGATGTSDPQIMVRSLRGVDAEHLTLADADLSRCLIYGLRRPEQLRLAGGCRFAPAPRKLYLRWGWLPWRWTARDAL